MMLVRIETTTRTIFLPLGLLEYVEFDTEKGEVTVIRAQVLGGIDVGVWPSEHPHFRVTLLREAEDGGC